MDPRGQTISSLEYSTTRTTRSSHLKPIWTIFGALPCVHPTFPLVFNSPVATTDYSILGLGQELEMRNCEPLSLQLLLF